MCIWANSSGYATIAASQWVAIMSNQCSTPLPGSAAPSPNRRLDSWKEIAAYLRREVRTVQRWEKTAKLPVHRLQLEKHSAVYAFTSELDAWCEERRPNLESDADASKGEQRFAVFERLRQLLRRPMIATAVASVMLTVSAGTYFVRKSSWFRARSALFKIKLAVLPFKNIGGNPGEEYFSDGMTEEMITELGRLQPERLGVIARTSSMLYKNSQKDLNQICRELDVQYILEGSVFRVGDRTRITAQLVQCGDQTHIWADSAEGDLLNVVSLQADVAQAVAKNVRIALTPNDRSRLSATRQVNPEAYQNYLKGLHVWARFTPDGTRAAIKYFQNAIDKDPSYAPAYAGLARCYVYGMLVDTLSSEQTYALAKAAAMKAAALDNNSAEAHVSLANLALRDRDWFYAGREFRRAIELDPNLSIAHLGYGSLLLALRKPDDAWNQLRTGQSLDPLSPVVGQTLVESLYYSRKYDEAIATAKQWIELYPNSSALYDWLAECYVQKGMDSLAVEEYLKGQELGGSRPSTIRELRTASHKSGLMGLWEAKETMDQDPTTPGFNAFDVAYDYATLADRDNSVAWLAKAYKENDFRLVSLGVEPRFDFLRSDPRFQKLINRMGLPQ
jgi:TolB-like protein